MKAREFFKGINSDWQLPSSGMMFRTGPDRPVCLMIKAVARSSPIEIRDAMGAVEWDIEYINSNGGLFETRSDWIENFEIFGVGE